MSCFDNTHSWKVRCTYHIGKRRIFVGRRDCRSASVLRHWDSVLFFAYPMGGVNLLILINFQKLLVICRNACSNAERKFFVAPPPCPVSAVKETLFIREIRNYIPRAVRHAFWLFQLMYHTSSYTIIFDIML